MLGILVALAGIIYAAGVWVALNTTCLPPISIQSSSGQTIIDEDSCRCADFVYRDAAYTCEFKPLICIFEAIYSFGLRNTRVLSDI